MGEDLKRMSLDNSWSLAARRREIGLSMDAQLSGNDSVATEKLMMKGRIIFYQIIT